MLFILLSVRCKVDLLSSKYVKTFVRSISAAMPRMNDTIANIILKYPDTTMRYLCANR